MKIFIKLRMDSTFNDLKDLTKGREDGNWTIIIAESNLSPDLNKTMTLALIPLLRK